MSDVQTQFNLPSDWNVARTDIMKVLSKFAFAINSNRLDRHTVSTLPTGIAGDIAFATNGRKNGEGGGAGTGVMVFHDGTAWRACDTGATAAA